MMENDQQPLASGQQIDQLNPALSKTPYHPSKTFIILIMVFLIFTISVGGYILGANQNQVAQNLTPPVPPIAQPSPTPVDETANWKTYRNEEFGFEVRYPSVYDGKDNCRPRVVDSGKENAVVFVGPITFRMDNAKGLTLSEYVDWIVQQIEEDTQKYSVSKVKSKSNITFSGSEAVKLVTQFCGVSCSEPQDIYIEKGENILRINYDDGIINQCPFNSYNLPSEVADQILPTSKFLSPEQTIDTSSWKTYTNTKHGFYFKLPNEHTAYENADQKKSVLVPASTTSNTVNVAVKESMVFCCEPTTLSFSIKTTTKTPRVWVEEYLQSIPEWKQEIPTVKDTTFAGKSAVEANGRGGYGPPYKLIAVSLNASLLVIIQNLDDPLLSEVLSAFKFTQ